MEIPAVTRATAEQVRAMSVRQLRADPALWEAYNRGWEDRNGQITRALRTPSPRQREPRGTDRKVRVAAKFPPTTAPQTLQHTARAATRQPGPRPSTTGPPTPVTRFLIPKVPEATTSTTKPDTRVTTTARLQNAAQRRSAKRKMEFMAKKQEERRARQLAPPQPTTPTQAQQQPSPVSPPFPSEFPLPDPPRPFTAAEVRAMFLASRTQPMETESPANSVVESAISTPQGPPAVMGTATQLPSENLAPDEPMAVTPVVEEVEEDFPSFHSCTPATSPRRE